jgi:quinol monooxygenase YgiN
MTNSLDSYETERRQQMLIVAGSLYVHPSDRDAWVEAHHDVVQIARRAHGCVDLYFCADPIDESRVNMFEQWESEEALEAWRAVAEPPPKPEILSANVFKYQIASTGPPL